MVANVPQVTGILEAREPDYMVVRTDATRTKVAWADVSRLQVQRGRKGNAGIGALIGFGVGGVLGGLIGAAVCDDEGGLDTTSECSGAEGALVGGLMVGAAGAGIGALIGLAAKTDRWVDVPPDRWRIEVAPDPRGGVAVGVNMRL